MNTEATRTVEEFTAEAQKTMETSVEKMTQSVEDVSNFSRENVEAVVASSKRAAKAAEEMNAEIAAYAKRSYEDGLAAAKDMTGAKSMTEFFEKQTTFAKSALEAYVAEATKLNEMMTSATKEIFEPLNARFTAASDMVKSELA
ncbi:TIGR01841 family phasin [Paralimibaculum aggregatum]|uniref:TIGR01841 family phasin n=1 Tax=Paralimibaculum aggregatum TaxID=3036245 RepID=A0ABQ6LL05_9RHOB|nr:TIGR01841 family phasin [Limibaculum sp. NKW23]GMG81081.1 TIGR01841 family phasin [Limibaculum sp. NKW23]